MRISMAVSVLLLTSCVALAGPASMQRMSVPYSDLNVASQKGAETLHHRIEVASHIVCGPRPDMRDLDNASRFNQCVAQSMTKAMADVQVVEHTAQASSSVTVTR